MLNFYPTNGLNSITGYGKMELGITKAFYDLGVKFTIWPDPTYPTLVVGNPLWHIAPHIEGHRLWLYTMNETDQVGQSWVDAINNHYELVFVPAAPMVDIFKSSGVIIPVHFVPLGVNWYPPIYKTRTVSKPFTFLTYSLGDMRKGAELAMMAFNRVFGDDMGYKLIIKCRENFKIFGNCTNQNVEVVGGHITEQEWHNLLYRSHAFVFPSKGEGYGLPPREAVLSGLPTIATQWLGMWDANKWGLPLKVKEMKRATFDQYEANAEGALWSIPNSAQLDDYMQWIVNHYEDALAIAQKGNNYLRTHQTWEHTAQSIMQHLNIAKV